MKRVEVIQSTPIMEAKIQVPFSKYVGGLLDTHKLIAETCNISSQAPAFGILDQYDQTQHYAAQHN